MKGVGGLPPPCCCRTHMAHSAACVALIHTHKHSVWTIIWWTSLCSAKPSPRQTKKHSPPSSQCSRDYFPLEPETSAAADSPSRTARWRARCPFSLRSAAPKATLLLLVAEKTVSFLLFPSLPPRPGSAQSSSPPLVFPSAVKRLFSSALLLLLLLLPLLLFLLRRLLLSPAGRSRVLTGANGSRSGARHTWPAGLGGSVNGLTWTSLRDGEAQGAFCRCETGMVVMTAGWEESTGTDPWCHPGREPVGGAKDWEERASQGWRRSEFKARKFHVRHPDRHRSFMMN